MPDLRVDLETCNRTGMCTFEHPELFEEDDDGFPVVRADAPTLSEAEIGRVLTTCPTGSIHRLCDEAAPAGGD